MTDMSTAQESVRKTYNERGWKAIRNKQYVEAESLFQAAVKEAEANEAEDVTLAKSLFGLAFSLEEQRKYTEAEPVLTRSSTLFTNIDGPNSDGVTEVFNQHNNILQTQGKYDEAARLIKQQISSIEKQFGKNDLSVGYFFAELALLKSNECDFAEAESWFKKALANTEYNVSKRKTSDVSLGSCLCNLARVNYYQGRHVEAGLLNKRALGLLEKARNQSLAEIVIVLNDISNLNLALEKFDDALKYRRRSVKLLEEEFTTNHMFLAEYRRALAILLEIQGDTEEADKLDGDALKWLRSRRRWGTVTVAASQSALRKAEDCLESGDFCCAEHCFRCAIRFYENALGPEDGNVANLYDKMANAINKQGRSKESAVYRRRAERIRLIPKDVAARDGTAVGDNPIPLKIQEYFERAEALRVNRVNTLQGKIDGLKIGVASDREKFKAQSLKQLLVWEKSRDELNSLRLPTAPLPLPMSVGDIGFQEDLVDVFIWDERTISAKMYNLESAKKNKRDILCFQVKPNAELGDGWKVEIEAAREVIVANVDAASISKTPRLSAWPAKLMLRVAAEKPDVDLLKRFPEERRKRIQDLVVLEPVENPSDVEKYRKLFY